MKRLILLPVALAAFAAGWIGLRGGSAERVVFLTDEAPVAVAPAAGKEWQSVLRVLVRERDGRVAIGCGVWTENGAYTAWHVVSDAVEVAVVDHAGTRHMAWGWWRLGGQDAALMRLEAPLSSPAVKVASSPVTASGGVEALAYWGFAHFGGRHTRVIGYLDLSEAVSRANVGAAFYATNVPAERGMSGSPLFASGVLVGVLSHRVDPPRASFYAPVDTKSAPLEPWRYKKAPAPAPPPAQAFSPVMPRAAPPKAQVAPGGDCKT